MTDVRALETLLMRECQKYEINLVGKYQKNLKRLAILGKEVQYYDELCVPILDSNGKDEKPFETKVIYSIMAETFEEFRNLKALVIRQQNIINSIAFQLHLKKVAEIEAQIEIEMEALETQELLEFHERLTMLESVAQPLTAFSYAT